MNLPKTPQGIPEFFKGVGSKVTNKLSNERNERMDHGIEMDNTSGSAGDPSSESRVEATRIDPRLEPKLFFWDNIIFYLASAILGLSVSNIVVDFLRPEPNAVACYTPPNTSRDQAAYINNYCNDHLPFTENFTLALVIHGAVLLAPQYLWKAYFSARMDFFFTHAAKLETLRERDTGEYPPKNFNVVDYMYREFHDRWSILMGYRIKLISQLCIVALAIGLSVQLFQEFNIEFYCPDRDEPEHDIFKRVRCSYAKLRFVSILRLIDYGLLGASLLVLLYGLYWSTICRHPELEHEKTSQFCYQFCINSKFYTGRQWNRLRSDLDFLLVSLFATNTGLGRVFKSVQIANDISEELSAHLESMDTFDSMKHPEREPDIKENNRNFFEESKPFTKAIYVICKGIKEKLNTRDLYPSKHPNPTKYKIGAMDIACGYHSYLFSIARCHELVISIILDPYYKNRIETFKKEVHHGGIRLLRIPTNLFGLPTKYKDEFIKQMDSFTGRITSATDKLHTLFSLIVIGPLDTKRKVNTVNQIIEIYSRAGKYFSQGCVMLTFRPIAVERKNISKYFLDWEPESIKFWNKSNSLEDINGWLTKEKLDRWLTNEKPCEKLKTWFTNDSNCDCKIIENNFNKGYGKIEVRCENLKCKFELKTYTYMYEEKGSFV